MWCAIYFVVSLQFHGNLVSTVTQVTIVYFLMNYNRNVVVIVQLKMLLSFEPVLATLESPCTKWEKILFVIGFITWNNDHS